MDTVPLTRRGRSVSGEVAAYLEALIHDELTAGDRLPPERELAASLQVSRSSVRKAMLELEQRRRVARTRGRGTTVLPESRTAAELERSLVTSSAEQADVAELRLVVEPQIAGLAAERATDADLVLLERTLAASHAGLTPRESLELDVQFHLQLAGATWNPLLVALCGVSNGWVQDVRARSHATRAGRRASIEGHRALYQAVVARDAKAATTAMIAHLQGVAALVKKGSR
jgi:GntR family transcriptional regulator, transcriptional repressor for pyruvate dehydrogenase complex